MRPRILGLLRSYPFGKTLRHTFDLNITEANAPTADKYNMTYFICDFVLSNLIANYY